MFSPMDWAPPKAQHRLGPGRVFRNHRILVLVTVTKATCQALHASSHSISQPCLEEEMDAREELIQGRLK